MTEDYINQKARQLGGIIRWAAIIGVIALMLVCVDGGKWVFLAVLNVALIAYALSERRQR